MSSSSAGLSLGEAARRFLASLPPEEREASQQEVYRFVRWYGWDKSCADLAPPHVASYAEQLSLSDADYARKLDLVREFLVYIRKEGCIENNLAIHLKVRKGKPRSAPLSEKAPAQPSMLTAEGYAELEAELDTLKNRRTEAIDEVRRAAADKDFRENAPLEAAREQRGQIEGRIREIEEILKSAVVMSDRKSTLKVGFGNSVLLRELASGEEIRYTLVSPTEVDPARQRISSASPLGKAIVGKGEGDTVEVVVPAGKLRYEIKRIER